MKFIFYPRHYVRSYGVMVSTLDSESSDPCSNPEFIDHCSITVYDHELLEKVEILTLASGTLRLATRGLP